MQDLELSSCAASEFLKGLASPQRLRILCHLADGEKNVTELVQLTGMLQTSVSQHLKKLRDEGIVDYQRDHRTLTYFISDKDAQKVLAILHKRFCDL